MKSTNLFVMGAVAAMSAFVLQSAFAETVVQTEKNHEVRVVVERHIGDGDEEDGEHRRVFVHRMHGSHHDMTDEEREEFEAAMQEVHEELDQLEFDFDFDFEHDGTNRIIIRSDHENEDADDDEHHRVFVRRMHGSHHDMSDEDRPEFEAEMHEFEIEMRVFEGEMRELGQEMAQLVIEMGDIEGEVMAELEASGIRIESNDNGNDTVWISGDARNEGEADMRVVSSDDGNDLIYMYFNGFDEDYQFVIEEGDDGDAMVIHAYDTAAVFVVESSRHEGQLETDFGETGRPHLTVRTNDSDDVSVVRLNRRHFD